MEYSEINPFDEVQKTKQEISNIEESNFFKRLKLSKRKNKLKEYYKNLYNLLQENANINPHDFAQNIAEILTQYNADKDYFLTDYILQNKEDAFLIIAPFDTTYYLRSNYYMLDNITNIEDITFHISNDDFIVIPFNFKQAQPFNVLNSDCKIKEELISKYPELENYIKSLVINNINNVTNYNYANEYARRIRKMNFNQKKIVTYQDAIDEELEAMGDDPHYSGKHHRDTAITLLECSLLIKASKLYKDLEETYEKINNNKI